MPARLRLRQVATNSEKPTRMLSSLSRAARQAIKGLRSCRFSNASWKIILAPMSGFSRKYIGHFQTSRKFNSFSVIVPLLLRSSGSSQRRKSVRMDSCKRFGKPCISHAWLNSSKLSFPLWSESIATKKLCKSPNSSSTQCLNLIRSNACSGANSKKERLPVWSLSKLTHSSSKFSGYPNSFKPCKNSCFCSDMFLSASSRRHIAQMVIRFNLHHSSSSFMGRLSASIPSCFFAEIQSATLSLPGTFSI
mmetsp:Transcript_76394/g.139163  ORF Transcript_76394/g.139163 Transcript_76394/m.139163 type:complete len:249 (-) Transcript_76394:225-971(-)